MHEAKRVLDSESHLEWVVVLAQTACEVYVRAILDRRAARAQRALVHAALGAEEHPLARGTAKSLGGPLNLSQLCSPRLDRQASSAAQGGGRPERRDGLGCGDEAADRPRAGRAARQPKELVLHLGAPRQPVAEPGVGVLLERVWVR